MLRYLLCIYSIFNICFLCGQSNRPYFDPVMGVYGSIYAIHQDEKGYLWFGTKAGFHRYDGTEFKSIDTPDSLLTLENNYVQAITEDVDQRLWLGTRNGLYVINKERTEVKSFGKGELSNLEIRKIQEDQEKGLFWIATYGGGLNLYNEKKGIFTYYKGDSNNEKSLPGNNVNDLIIDSKNRLWTGSEVGGLGLFSRSTGDFYNVPLSTHEKSYTVSAIAEDSNGVIWVGTWSKGLFKYDEFSQQLTQVYRESNKDNPKNTIRRIIPDLDNQLILATLNGVAIFQPVTGEIQFSTHDGSSNGSIVDNSIWSIYKDREDILWVGTLNKGVCKWDKKAHKFNPLVFNKSSSYALQNDGIKTLYYDQEDVLWIATVTGNIHILSLSSGEFYDNRALEPIKMHGVNGMVKDEFGNLWIVSEFGVFRYNHELKKLDSYSKSLFVIEGEEMGGTNSCAIGLNGDLYIAGWGTGLMVLPREKQNNEVLEARDFKHYTIKNSNIKTNVLWQVLSDGEGHVWINSRYGCYVFLERQQKILPLTKQGKLSLTMCKYVNTVYGFDPLGKVYKLQVNHAPKAIKEIKGTRIEFLKIDPLGRMWLSSTEGLSIRSLNEKKQLFRFDENDGIPDEPITTIEFIKNTKKVVLGTEKGIVIKDLDGLVHNKNAPKLVLNDILLFGESMASNNSLGRSFLDKSSSQPTFAHNQNGLSFVLSPMAMSSTSSTDIFYKLDIEEQWHTTTKSNPIANYPYLSPGSYTLLAQTKNSSAYVSPIQEIFTFRIQYPWWQRWWAIVIYALIFLILIRIAFSYSLISIKAKNKLEMENYQAEQQEKLLQSKIHFFTNISHDIKTPLTLILGPINKILGKQNDESIVEPLRTVKKNAEHLHSLFDELLEFRKIESGVSNMSFQEVELIEFTRTIISYYTELAQMRSIKVIFESSEKEIKGLIDKKKIEKILHNLLSNAFKFTSQNNEISVEINKKEINAVLNVCLIVTDSGPGISDEIKNRIFERFVSGKEEESSTGIGLALVKQIVELHGGKIEVQNVETGGAQFKVTFPLVQSKNDEINEKIEAINIDNNYNTILLVEDNYEIQRFIVSLLEDKYSVLTANNGKDGLEVAKKLQPDLIVSDVMMPKMDGFQFCDAIKSNIDLSHIPIVILTARSSNEGLVEGLRHRADSYLTKPFDSDVLLLTIKNLLVIKREWKQKFQLETTTDVDASQIESLDEKLLKDVIHVIDVHITNSQLNVNLLSEKLGMHRSTLSKKLKALTGFSPSEFVKHIRLKKGYELLQSGKINVSDVAYKVGYSNPKYFSTSFKRQFGVSPSEVLSGLK